VTVFQSWNRFVYPYQFATMTLPNCQLASARGRNRARY